MTDLYTLNAVWRKTSGELLTTAPHRYPRTLEEYVDALAKVASGWNFPPFAPPPLPTRATVEAYARFVHSHPAPEFGCTLESLTLEPAGE
nr:MAG TPA: hypothetical protein [Caudoviricetes sp.]